jgi:uncharacterized membrane protein (Fun14 family)
LARILVGFRKSGSTTTKKLATTSHGWACGITGLGWGFILGPVVWYSHRKMYLMALGIIGIYMLVTFFEEYFNLGLGSVSFAATNIILALMAKSTYLQHIIDFFHRNREISGQQLDDLIASNGGTSKIAAFLFFAFSIMAIILASITGDIVAGHEISFLTSDQTTSIVTQRQ